MKEKLDLKNFTEKALIEYVESTGQSRFRAKQIMGWLYRPNIHSFDEMTDLAKTFREYLNENCRISSFEDPIIEKASDGCVKFGFRLNDGHILESVFIPEEERNTLCISSQVGCAMGCTFCLTGTMGFIRNLTVAEIVNQVCGVRDYLLKRPEEELIGPSRVTNIVYMGMGEPLNNLENVLDSINILTHNKGLDVAARKITVSTCGIVPKLQELGEKSNVNLAISLHAITDKIRSSIMPVNNRYNLEELLEACRNYPLKRRKRIMFEYTLLKGINDSDMDARMLVSKLRDIPCKINLLAYNKCPELPYSSPDKKRILAFQQILLDAHYTVFIRSSRGDDISAACGQLATGKKS